MKGTFFFGKPARNYQGACELDFGDDAIPYMGPCLISVADGTGARGGFPQRNINPRLFRREDSFETATRGCLGKEPSHYREQYEENFHYLLNVGEDYNEIGARKSGYFGSRLTGIFMRYLVEEKLFHTSEELAEHMHTLRNAAEEERDAILSRYEQGLASRLNEKLTRAVKNCDLDWDYENDNNLSLMGTTYSGAIFLEEEDEVHMISIQAGDSLIAALVPVEGADGRTMLAMRRLLPAQERAYDGGLTNCVGINHEFYFRCGYHCVKKPCAILACSDGCVDAFPSERWFEHFLMTQLGKREHADLHDAMKSMRSYYATPINKGADAAPIYVSSDDSSTMALAAFGFEHYVILCRMAEQRVKYLNDRYQMAEGSAKLALTMEEEMWIEDNQVKRNREKTAQLRPYAERCWDASEWLRQKNMKRLEEPTNEARVEAEIKAELSRNDSASRECAELEKQLKKKVEWGWLILREKMKKPAALHHMRRFSEDPGEKIVRLDHEREDMETKVRELRLLISRYAEQLADYAGQYSLPEGDAAKIRAYHTENMLRIGQQVRKMQDVGNELEQCLRKIESIRQEEDKTYRKLLADEATAINSLCEKLLENEELDSLREFSEDDRRIFDNLIEKIRRLRAEIRRRIEQTKVTVREQYARKLFMNRPVAMIEETILEHSDSLPEELRTELQAIMNDLEERFPLETEKSRREKENNKRYAIEFEEIMEQKE